MALGRIKTRESVKDIKILDKAAVVSERMKTALVRSKDQAENLMDDGQISPSEYAEDKIRYAAEDVTDQVWHEVSGQTKKAIEKGKDALGKVGINDIRQKVFISHEVSPCQGSSVPSSHIWYIIHPFRDFFKRKHQKALSAGIFGNFGRIP